MDEPVAAEAGPDGETMESVSLIALSAELDSHPKRLRKRGGGRGRGRYHGDHGIELLKKFHQFTE